MSTEVKREVFENTVLLNLAHIPKGCTHASRAGATVPTVFLTQMEIICHFARECRFAKYQENRANGRNEKRIVAIEDSNSKALTHALWTRWTLMILTGANVMWHKLSLDFDDSTSEIGLISDDEEMMFQKVKGNAFNSEIVESSFEKQWIAIGSMTGDKDKLSDFKEFKGGYVAFGNDSKGGRISGKGTIKTSCLDFEKVSYVEELKFNLLSVSLISQPMLPKDRMLPKRSVIVLKNKALHDELGIHKIHPQSQIIGKSSAGFHNKKKFKTVFKPTSELGTQGTSLKALAMKVGLKRCKKNCFIQATRGIGCYVDYQRLEDKRWCGFVEVFAPVAELKHQTLFAEEVYVKQPPGFEDPAHTNKEYRREAIDNTLFIKKDRRDLMLVQVYVSYQSLDPHVFYGEDFEDLMQKEFKMRHFNKFDFCTSKPASTPIEVIKSLGKDEEGEDVDKSNVRRMSVSWRRLVLAMQETNNCGYLLYEAEYVSDEVVVLRFVQLFLNKQLEGVDRPQDFIPSVSLPSKVFTFMRKHRLANVLQGDAHGSQHQCAAHSQRTASVQGTASFHSTANSQGTAEIQEEGLRRSFLRILRGGRAGGEGGGDDKELCLPPDFGKKSDETEEVNIEEKEASNVRSGDTEELDLETTQSTARQGTITPRTLNFEDEAGPSSPLRPIQVMDSEEQLKAAEVLVSISRPRGLSIPAIKNIDIKEGLKTKTYEISVVNQKHDELVKKSLLTRSQFEGQLKEKSKVISDLKVKEGKDIDTMIEMEKQIKFLNEILYKRNQSIQTIHMLAPKCATYHGRSTFANPKYLKKAQSDKPCLYEIPYDTSDPANRFCPDGEDTVTLEKESRSKLDKDKVKPYNYTYQNSLYETFKPPSKAYLDQLERAKEVRKTMWRKTFVRTKPNIAKNVGFLPMSKSISKSRLLYNEMTNNFNHFRTICQQTWSNHTSSAFPNPTAKSMEVLIKILLMPLSDKTILDSHCFIHELKREMNDDLEYVNSLEKELDELESEKADFSNIYDLLLEECVSKDVTCSYLHSLSDLNANTELQCLYLHKVKECECLAQKLSKQTESVNKEVHNNLLKSFSKLEKHSISLELSLQHCKEQMKNNPVCKENASNVFRKEREQYHEIQDLKAQMQDKNIAISELKKLIENCKGKSVETQFNKPSVVRQPNAQRIPKPSVLGKPTPFSNSPEMRSFQTKQSVNKTNVSDGLFKQVTQQNLPQIRKQAVRNTNVIAPGPSRNCPKHVSHQSPREKVGSNDMVHNYYLEKAKKSAQLQKDKEVNGKPSMIDPARLPNTANGCKPKPRNWQASMSSRVSNKDVHLGEHRKQKPFLKFNDLQCPTCKKCLYSANHDECVLEYLSKLNPRASAQIKDAKSHNTTKRYVPVEKTSESKKPERLIPKGHRWVPTGKLLNSCMGKVDSEPTHGSIVDIPHIHACKQTLGLSAGTPFNGQKQQRIDLNADALYNEKQENLRVWLLKLLISKKPVPECSSLGRQCQMASAENNTSGPVPQFKFKAGSKSCSLSSKDSYIMTRVGITIPPSHSNAEDNRHSMFVAMKKGKWGISLLDIGKGGNIAQPRILNDDWKSLPVSSSNSSAVDLDPRWQDDKDNDKAQSLDSKALKETKFTKKNKRKTKDTLA
ncbi:hypothetical protein Tco_0138282 [Tanacetum coccineum]